MKHTHAPLFLSLGKPLQLVLASLLLVFIAGAWWTVAASLDAPSAPTDPASQSYTLADICNQLQTGATPTIATTFTEPELAPDQDMCSLNTIYDLLPEPDPTNAAQSVNVASGTAFWALNPSGQWGQRTGSGTFSVLTDLIMATGQTSCYRYNNNNETTCGNFQGQDGFYQLGATADPRFTDNANGTVTDNLTELVWLKDANCAATLGGVAKTTTLVWADALTWSNNMASGSCGLTDGSVAGDWRLPNITELESLVNLQNSSPSLPTGHPFTSVVSSPYWSSTTKVAYPQNAWIVDFRTGSTGSSFGFGKTDNGYVWPVR